MIIFPLLLAELFAFKSVAVTLKQGLRFVLVWLQAQTSGLWSVQCRGKKATMDRSKYISGFKGACINYNGQWITPNKFEELSGRSSPHVVGNKYYTRLSFG
jgi:hypothetical protein